MLRIQGRVLEHCCLKKSALESSNFSTLESAAVRSGSGHATGVKSFLSQKKKLYSESVLEDCEL